LENLVIDLQGFGLAVDVFDPWCSSSEAKNGYCIKTIENLRKSAYHKGTIAVSYGHFKAVGIQKIRC
jgi:UDP-N-acetyl-D-galactosamine dehydrogenase